MSEYIFLTNIFEYLNIRIYSPHSGSRPWTEVHIHSSIHVLEIFFSEHKQNTTEDTTQVHHRKNKVFETVTRDIEARARKERDEPRKMVSPIHQFTYPPTYSPNHQFTSPHQPPIFNLVAIIFIFKVSSSFFNPHCDQIANLCPHRWCMWTRHAMRRSTLATGIWKLMWVVLSKYFNCPNPQSSCATIVTTFIKSPPLPL